MKTSIKCFVGCDNFSVQREEEERARRLREMEEMRNKKPEEEDGQVQ